MKRSLITTLLGPALLTALPAVTAEKRPLSIEDFLDIHWVEDPRLSPDGKTLVFTSTLKSLKKGKVKTNLYIDSVYEDRRAVRFTRADGKDFHPRFSPDGKEIAFLSTRSGTPQIWKIPAGGGEARRITQFPTGISSFAWSPDGRKIAFAADVWVECGDDFACLEKKVSDEEKAGGKMIEWIPFRVWNSWRDGRRSRIFVVSSSGKGEVKALTPPAHDVPPIDLGTDHDFVWSPDGKLIAFVMNETKEVAWNTQNDLFLVPAAGGEPGKISTSAGSDVGPLFSPDGRFLAYLSQERAGFEADRRRIILYELAGGKSWEVSHGLSETILEFVWSPDSKGFYFIVPEKGRRAIHYTDLEGKRTRKIFSEGHNRELRATPDGKSLVFLHETSSMSPNIFRIDAAGKKTSAPVRLTWFNHELLEGRALGSLEEFWFEGARGDRVHGFLMKPPGFDPGRKYPAIFLLHGGPQGDWDDSFHPRWNTQMFASRGFVLVMINFHGSIGYGQEFVDSISGHWGDWPLEDVMKGVQHVVESCDFVDPERLGAAGASYGGYLANWLMGNTGEFRAIFTHAGVWDLESDYGSTEELWFPEWEFGGTPWDAPDLYEKFSPSSFIENIKKHRTPTLVSHGAGDFRVAVEQGIQLFTVLQRLGIESKLMFFPDEDHFVKKPGNVKLFYATFLGWFEEHLKKEGGGSE